MRRKLGVALARRKIADGDASLADYEVSGCAAIRSEDYEQAMRDAEAMIAVKPSSDSGRYLATICLLYTSPSPRDLSTSRMPSSA